MYAIALGVARNRVLPAAPTVPSTYGEQLTVIQRDLGVSDRELARVAGRKGGPKDQTMRRLRIGTGSIKSAVAVRDALIKLGAKDVPPVPVVGTTQTPRLEGWQQRWIELGRRIRAHATDEQFAKCVADLNDLADALERVAHHMAAISRPPARDIP
jgi:hypothetical protein